MPQPTLAWNFDGTTKDYIRRLTATVNGAVTYGTGKSGQSIVIINDVTANPGANNITWSYTLNIDSGVTVAFWVKLYEIGANTQTMLQYGGPAPGGGSVLIFSMNASGSVSIWYKDAGYHGVSTPVLAINTWYHLCITVGSGTVVGYVNGVPCGVNSYTPSGQTVTGGALGAYGSNKYTPATGEYDDLRMFNTALSATQVQAIYDSQGALTRTWFFASSPQPTLRWQFDSSNVESNTGLTPSSQVSPGPGFLQGGATLVTNAPTSNTAVNLPGTTGSYVDMGPSSPAAVNAKTSNIFVEAWVYHTSASADYYQGIIATSLLSQQWALHMISANRAYLWIDGPVSVIYSRTVPLNTWTHVSFSWALGPTSNTAYMFVNGLSAGSVTSTKTVNADTGNVVIGSINNDYFSGYIRDVRVVQGGVVPKAAFTPEAAPFSYSLPSYVTGSGSTVFTLLSQFITYVPGIYNQAISISNPTGTAVSYLVYDISPRVYQVNSGFSRTVWVRFTNLSTLSTFAIFEGVRTSVLSTGMYHYLNSSGLISSRFADGTSTFSTITGPVAQLNTWYHLATVLVNGTMTYYVNGVLIDSATYTQTPAVTAQYYTSIGARTTGDLPCIGANIDDLRVFNTALSATQVQAIYTARGPLTSSNLTKSILG